MPNPPKCKLCGFPHWSHEPHQFGVGEAGAGARKHGGETAKSVVFTAKSVVSEPVRTAKIAVKKTGTAKSVVSDFDETAKIAVSANSPDCFGDCLHQAGLTIRQFSMMTGTPQRTVEDWSRGATRVPGIALAVLRLLERFPEGRALLTRDGEGSTDQLGE